MAVSTVETAQSRSVQNVPSETAMATALLWAIGAQDARVEVRGQDTLAVRFLSDDRKALVEDPGARQRLLANKIAPGAYEFMLARTAYFDDVVRAALEQRVPQLVFLGAGYDTRPYRFRDLAEETRIFELDSRPTQERKREILQRESIGNPPNLVFAPIDFAADALGRVLLGARFSRDAPALFAWEGVSYYLSAAAVDGTLEALRATAAPGSSICFDYASLSAQALNERGGKILREHMAANHPGEPSHFGIPKGGLETFLEPRGYRILEHLDAAQIQARYLTLKDGTRLPSPPPLFAFGHAETRRS